MKSLISNIKESFHRLWYGKKNSKEWQEIRKTLGEPGWYYVKKEYYNAALKLMEEDGLYDQLERTLGETKEIVYKDFEYKNQIIACNFSKEVLLDDDIIIPVWRVSFKK